MDVGIQIAAGVKETVEAGQRNHDGTSIYCTSKRKSHLNNKLAEEVERLMIEKLQLNKVKFNE